jgi:elongation factor P
VSISTNDLKNGMALNLPEGLVTVVEFQHVKPGKGGAFVRTRLKNVRSGAVLDRTFRADEKVPLAVIDKRDMQFLYREGTDYVFMDNETYDQLHVAAENVGNAVNYLKEGDTVV